jgi:Flp pilus assembly protein TadD
LTWSVYGFNAEAMTRNNLGGCALGFGELGRAENQFRAAIQLDPENPLPHYNLAIVAELGGDRDGATEFLTAAQRLGYNQTGIDQLIHAAGEYLARVEGSAPRREEA